MDCGGEMHQQYLKDFIQSLQSNSDDSHSLSESALNPNAAVFIPSYKKSSGDEEEERQEKKEELGTSTTTLVRQEIIGDTAHIPHYDTQNRVQRQLLNLMDQLGNHNFPLSSIQFSLSPDAQGINVRFMMPGVVSRTSLDENLCLASGLHVEIGNKKSRTGLNMAAQFLNRMCAALSDKGQTKESSICPRCTALPRKHSYTELEIERQIEDIKAFEKLINTDDGARYQDAFKELCHKLGLAPPEVPMVSSEIGTAAAADAAVAAAAVPMPIIDTQNEHYPENHEVSCNEDDALSGYEWDSFMPEFDHKKAYGLTEINDTEMLTDDQEQDLDQMQMQVTPREDYVLNVPPSTPAMSTTTTNVSSVFPKLYKVAQMKCNSNARKAAMHKEKESKLQRSRFLSPSRGGVPSAAPTKKQGEQLYVTGNRAKTLARELPNKSGLVKNHMPEMTTSQILKSNCKIESRSLAKNQSEHLNGTKHSKISTLPRSTVGTGATLGGTKLSATGATTRVVVPRMTQASKMRQSEVKRRLSLMRGEDTDVQFNEYLFK